MTTDRTCACSHRESRHIKDGACMGERNVARVCRGIVTPAGNIPCTRFTFVASGHAWCGPSITPNISSPDAHTGVRPLP